MNRVNLYINEGIGCHNSYLDVYLYVFINYFPSEVRKLPDKARTRFKVGGHLEKLSIMR